MDKPSYYMVIPAEVWEAPITAKAMILFGHISVLANKEKFCWANNLYFTKVMNISESTVCRCLNELEEQDFIYRELIYFPGTKQVKERRIFINVRTGYKFDNRSGRKNEARSGRKNEKDNKTSI
jgi:hypothetical protein